LRSQREREALLHVHPEERRRHALPPVMDAAGYFKFKTKMQCKIANLTPAP
jgi:hypothetical protein